MTTYEIAKTILIVTWLSPVTKPEILWSMGKILTANSHAT